jgi:hypothetical protein
MNWVILNLNCDLGFLPDMISEDVDLPVAKQLATTYAHGGGWNPQSGFILDKQTLKLTYPGDPPMYPLAVSMLRKELLLFYPFSYLLILQQDGSFEIARVD